MFLNGDGINLSAEAIKDSYGTVFSYSCLNKLSEKYGRLIETRSLVLILCDYDIDTVAFYYCMLANYIVPILADGKLSGEMIERLIERYRPQYVWKPADEECDKAVIQSKRHMLAACKSETVDLHPDLALLLTTSGSTGSPKLVRLSYNNLLENAKAVSGHLELQADDIAITTLPFHYCYGLSVMHMHWYMGATVCLTDWPLTSGRFWDFLDESRATNFATVPYHYEILNRVNFARRECPSVRFITQAGGKLPEKLQDFYGQILSGKGIRFYILYGQTEGTTVLSGIPCGRVLEKPGSVGVALAGLSAGIHHADRTGTGELVFRGSSVSMGYAEKAGDLKKGDDNQGILYTGDLACLDEEQYIYLKGRKKRFVKMLGIRLSLDELEDEVRRHYPGIQIACAGTDNHVRLFYEGAMDETALLTFCRKKFLIKQNMITVRKIRGIPRNSRGKVKYSELMDGKEMF